MISNILGCIVVSMNNLMLHLLLVQPIIIKVLFEKKL